MTPPHPAPQCPPFDPGALPLPSGRKSRVACQEPGAPGNYASCKHSPAAGLCQSRRMPGLAWPGAPQIQSRVGAPSLQPEATWRGGGRDWLFQIQPQPPPPPLAGSSTLASPPPPQLVSGVCELLMLSSLPCLEAGREGRLCLPRHTSGRSRPPAPRTRGAIWMYTLGPWASRPLRPCPALLGSQRGSPLGEGATGCGPRARCGNWRLAQSRACAGCGALAPT